MAFQLLIESMISLDIIERFLSLFIHLMPGGNKRSRTFKAICSFTRQVSLSLYDLLSPLNMKGLKENAYSNAFS